MRRGTRVRMFMEAKNNIKRLIQEGPIKGSYIFHPDRNCLISSIDLTRYRFRLWGLENRLRRVDWVEFIQFT